jgi:hypothetical protein
MRFVSNQTNAVPTKLESNDANPSSFTMLRFNHRAPLAVKRAGFADEIGRFGFYRGRERGRQNARPLGPPPRPAEASTKLDFWRAKKAIPQGRSNSFIRRRRL